jgi:hypothetical protein
MEKITCLPGIIDKEKCNMSERRDAYINKLKAMLVEWETEIDCLSAKEDNAGLDAKAEYHKRLAELRVKRDDLAARIETMHKTGEDEMEDLKFDLENAWKFLEEGLLIFKSEFQKGYKEGLKEESQKGKR